MILPETESRPASIGDVARETGLSKDTLRVWERRYGFPTPARNANDERIYPTEQIQRLRVIRRLLDSGLRPGKIVGLPLQDLSALGEPARSDGVVEAGAPDAPRELLELVKAHRADVLQRRLVQLSLQLGLRQFILDVIVPLSGLVGNAWLAGSLEIFEEHLYTQTVQTLLQHALGAMPPANLAPRVLLTTLPGEEHQLGILMAQVFFALDGARCVSLGTQTPPEDILKAVAAHRIDIVGLSCVAATSPRLTYSQLSLVRHRLDPAVGLWVGGAGVPPERHRVGGVRYVPDLRELSALLARWRAGSHALDSP